jgi:hypothetical protein
MVQVAMRLLITLAYSFLSLTIQMCCLYQQFTSTFCKIHPLTLHSHHIVSFGVNVTSIVGVSLNYQKYAYCRIIMYSESRGIW